MDIDFPIYFSALVNESHMKNLHCIFVRIFNDINEPFFFLFSASASTLKLNGTCDVCFYGSEEGEGKKLNSDIRLVNSFPQHSVSFA